MQDPASKKSRLLIIEDDQQLRCLLAEILSSGHQCSEAVSAEQALSYLTANSFDLVISDMNVGSMSGLELIPQIHSLSPNTIVVLICGQHGSEAAIEAMRAGAFDYITKPLDVRHVQAAVQRALDHHRLLKEERRYKDELESLLRQRTAEVNRLAYYDAVTELPNRALFEDRLAQAVAIARRARQIVGILFVSPDQLKKVNDTLGHGSGDRLLREVAERLKSCVTESDTVARLGGDDFALLLTQIGGTQHVVEIIGSIHEVLKPPFDLDGQELFATASVGVSLFPFDSDDSQILLKNARAALYRAKKSGGNNYQFYTADMHALAAKRLALETSLRHSIESQEFVVHYQPRVAIDSLQITGVEALVRWRHPQLGLLPPAEFIPLAEDTGLITTIGESVLRTACRQGSSWQDEGLSPMRMAVNISARQFQQQDIAQMVVRILEQTGMAPDRLELELTESSIMKDADFAIKVLSRLKAMGVKISIDDFGTGFSSLSYLKRLPIDCLKIDQSFVRDATTDPDDAALVMAIITLAHNLRLTVVAEGVETEEQLGLLRLLRCDEIQGYLFSKPLSAEALKKLLTAGFHTAQRAGSAALQV
jgi:diguanylate cyclase (GGDEF)-like protein